MVDYCTCKLDLSPAQLQGCTMSEQVCSTTTCTQVHKAQTKLTLNNTCSLLTEDYSDNIQCNYTIIVSTKQPCNRNQH